MGFRDHFRSSKRSEDRTSSLSSSASTAGKNTNGTTTPNHTIDNNNNNAPNPAALHTIETHKETKETAPAITLTKSHSRLSKTLSWHHSSSKPSKQEATKEKQIKAWAKEDAVEWTSPMSHRPGKKDAVCQNTLRAFDFRKAALGGENEGKGRSLSASSGVSPSASRVGSIDDGLTLGQMKEKRNSSDKARPGKLSQEITRDGEKKEGVPEKSKMQGVTEE